VPAVPLSPLAVRRRPGLLATVVVAAVALSGGNAAAGPARADGALVGTFAFRAGSCSGAVRGSYLRMILPTGTPSGPFLDNADSTCADQSYTPLTAGTDGGIVTGSYQPAPTPAYDGDGNSRAARINRPVSFFGVQFSTSTNATDLQSGQATRVPSLRATGGRITGDLSAVVATWNKQAFNQGSPKPDGSRPGNTTPVSGTYDAATQRFSITWTSQIVGGPFNDFTGLWHLEGTFRPAPGATAAPAPASGSPSAEGGAPPAAVAPNEAAPAPADVSTTIAPSAEVAAPDLAPDEVVASTHERRDGWRAPTWLIVGTAAVGVAAVLVLFRPQRQTSEVTA
jgi:hypothetical protein